MDGEVEGYAASLYLPARAGGDLRFDEGSRWARDIHSFMLRACVFAAGTSRVNRERLS